MVSLCSFVVCTLHTYQAKVVHTACGHDDHNAISLRTNKMTLDTGAVIILMMGTANEDLTKTMNRANVMYAMQ